jgi:hypothetical protein
MEKILIIGLQIRLISIITAACLRMRWGCIIGWLGEYGCASGLISEGRDITGGLVFLCFWS